MSLEKQPYKGTRDLYPEDMRLRNYIFDNWRQVVTRFGYEEYQAPLLEPLAMYAAKSGAEIVNDQTYRFTDRGEREVAIRPEMTPSISRMVAARRQEMPMPARLFSIANFMRYERPQHGREREFWQLNFDIFGAAEQAADLEILQLSDAIVRQFGATDEMFTIKVNDRRLTDYIFRDYMKLTEDETFATIKLMDRYDKISRKEFEAEAIEIREDFDFAKFDALIAAHKIADLPDAVREADLTQNVAKLLDDLKSCGVNNAVYDPTLMRGFDYYTGTVFEIFDEAPANRRAMFGGGRYDGLVGLFGVDDLPVVGAAPGETMFMEFLRAHDLLPKLQTSVDLVVVPFANVDKIVAQLRARGVNVAVDFTDRKADKKIKAAVKRGAPYLLFIGDGEIQNDKFQLKNLGKNGTEELSLTALINKLTV